MKKKLLFFKTNMSITSTTYKYTHMCVLLCVYLCVHKISLFDNAFCKYWHVILIPALNHHTCWCLLTSLFSSIGEIFLGKLIGYTWFSFLKYYICIIMVYLLVWSGNKKNSNSCSITFQNLCKKTYVVFYCQ